MTRNFEAELYVLLRTIAGWRRIHQYGPSTRELAEYTGASSTSIVQYRLLTLEKRGLVEREPLMARTLRLTEKGEQMVREQQEADAVA